MIDNHMMIGAPEKELRKLLTVALAPDALQPLREIIRPLAKCAVHVDEARSLR